MVDETRRPAVKASRHEDLLAGDFSSWLRRTRGALREQNGADVPCGGCTACCRSSQFIHIGPEEKETLARIPRELLFAAPGLPEGNVLLGYDENGHCPMLIDDRCSIYEHRPVTCRSYDCRVFSAAGIDASDDEKTPVTQHARRWRFDYATASERNEHAAVRASATFLRDHAECFPGGAVPRSPGERAVLAIKVHEVFLEREDERARSGRELARAVIQASEEFESGRD